jgi:hypothetical protein
VGLHALTVDEDVAADDFDQDGAEAAAPQPSRGAFTGAAGQGPRHRLVGGDGPLRVHRGGRAPRADQSHSQMRYSQRGTRLRDGL